MDLKIILQEGEGYKAEFKEDIGCLDRELAAFANSSGGRILLGIKDTGEIKGIEITNRLRSQIQDIANNCDPKIKIILEEIDNVLIINVKEGEDKPYKCSSGFYRRIGSNSQKLVRNDIISLFKSEGKIKFDELTEIRFNYPKDFDKNKLLKFLDLASMTKAIKAENMLTNIGAAEKQGGKLYFNNTGILFFAKEPQRFIPWSVFTVVLFKDYGGADVIDRKEITGSLFEIVDEVMGFVKLYAKVAYRFTGRPQREEVYEYSFEAIREAVINSVMHKDYFEHGHNNILKFFPDRIQIENIWIEPSHFILGKTVFRRNQLIADLLLRIHFGEKMGSGMKRMEDICKQENAPLPKVEYTGTHFYITFRQSKEYLGMAESEKVVRKGGQKRWSELTQKQQIILGVLKSNPKVSRKKLTEDLNINQSAVQKHIKKLKEEGILKRIGPDKGGYWEIAGL